MSSKIKYAVLFLLIVFSILINIEGFMKGLDWGCDYGGYILQAKTLVSGNYKELQENMSRNDFILNYPWGFPIILIPVINYFDTDPVLIKEYVFLFFLVSLGIIYILFKREKEYAFFTVMLVAASPYFWYFKNFLFSDFPNLCFVLISLVLIERSLIQKKQLINQWFDGCLIGLAIFISFTMRTQSGVLLLTLAIMQVLYMRKELLKPKNLVIALLPYLTFFLMNLVLKMIIPIAPISYFVAYKDIPWLSTIWANVFYYINVWKELFSEMRDLNQIDGIVAGITLLFSLIGLSSNWKNNVLYIVFILCFLAPIIVAPFYQGLRYLIPIIPVFFYFMVKGVFYATTTLYFKRGNLIAYLFLGSLTLFSFRSIALLSRTNMTSPFMMEGPYLPTSQKLFDYLEKNTDKRSLIGFWKPRVMLLYSSRNSVIASDYAECMFKNADYYVWYRNAQYDQISLDSIVKHGEQFKSVFKNNDFEVFKINKNTMFNAPAEIKEIKPANADELVLTINFDYFERSVIFGPEKLIPLWSTNVVKAKDFNLPEGNYLLSVYSKGTKAGGQFPVSQVILNDTLLGIFNSLEKATRSDFTFEVKKEKTLSLGLKMENDFQAKGEDRNAFIYFINIYTLK